MIKDIDITDQKTAEAVLHVQIPSYKVEAEIIGFYDIPPLKDTVTTLRHCEESFFGYYIQNELCGVISFKTENDFIDIHRLVVHPNHFRKGIAQKLLDYIESIEGYAGIKVATGSKNKPAVKFYQKNGFQMVKQIMVNEHLTLSLFEKHVNNSSK
ncbi:GNAT family N-acetyltransferase [Fredinandcohnia humi]